MTRALPLSPRLKPIALALACMGLAPAMAQILPTGGSVVGGNAAIGNVTALANGGAALGIAQSSNRAIINWTTFSIGALDQVNIVQLLANAVLLNRVTGSQASTIAGQINSHLAGTGAVNGSVFLINPNGVTFANGAVVNTGGLLASTMDIDGPDQTTRNASFMNAGVVNPNTARAELTFAGTGSAGVTVEEGASITAVPAAATGTGGAVTLLGASVSNAGTITATRGAVNLGSAANMTLVVDPVGDGLTTLRINSPSTIGALVENASTGSITADGGLVALRAASTAAETVVRQSGVLRAQTLGTRNGQIVLDGSAGSTQNLTSIEGGSIDATGGETGTGGSVTVNAQLMRFSAGAIDASGTTGGTVNLYADNAMSIAPGTTVDANGSSAAGGTVVIAARSELVTPAATEGNPYPDPTGGALYLSGAISARGATDGGTIVTRAGTLQLGNSTAVDAGGGTGANGSWTAESTHPVRVIVGNSESTVAYDPEGFPDGTSSSVVPDNVLGNTLQNATNVVLTSHGQSSTFYQDTGVRFEYQANVTKNFGRASTLTINSDTDVSLDTTTIAANAEAGALNININTDAAGAALPDTVPMITNEDPTSRTGHIDIYGSTLSTNGGDIRFYGQSDPVAGRALGGYQNISARLARVVSNGSQDGISIESSSFDTGAGSIVLRGQGATVNSYFGNDSGAGVVIRASTLETGSGAITIDGRGGTASNGVGIGAAYECECSEPTPAVLRSASGDITITGSSRNFVQGDTPDDYPGGASAGVALSAASVSTGGNVRITGTGGDTSLLRSDPTFLANAASNADGATYTYGASDGVSLSGSSITAGAGKSIVIEGTAGSRGFTYAPDATTGVYTVTPDSLDAFGVNILASANNGLQAAGGTIAITGVQSDVSLRQLSVTQFADQQIDGTGDTARTLLSTANTAGQGGSVTVTGRNVLVQGTDTVADIDASGSTGGGSIAIRGSAIGEVASSGIVAVDNTVRMLANATASGNGGQISLVGDTSLSAYGELHAHGAGSAGNGGAIETSGGAFDVSGAIVDTAASGTGSAGRWTIDPYDIAITHGAATGSLSSDVFAAVTTSTLQDGDINRALNGGSNVTIGTGTGGDPTTGDITFGSGVDINYNVAGGTRTLQFDAQRSIRSDDSSVLIRSTGAGGPLNVVFNADANNAGPSTGGGQVSYDGSIFTNGGNVTMNGNWSAIGGGDTAIHLTGTIDTRVGQSDAGAGGAVTLTGLTTTPVANGQSDQPAVWLQGASILASTGNVSITGTSTNNTGVAILGDSPAQGIHTTTGSISVTGLGTDTPANGSAPVVSQSGVLVSGANVTSTTGAITLHGRVADTAKTGSASAGVRIGNGAQVATSGAADIEITGSAVNNGAGVATEAGTADTVSGGRNVVLRAGNDGSADALVLGGVVRAANVLDLRPGAVDAGGTAADTTTAPITLGGSSATGFAVSGTEFAALAAPTIVFGSNTHAGDITVTGSVASPNALTLQNGGGGNIQINGTLQAQQLGLLSAGNITEGANGALKGGTLMALSSGGNVDLQNTGNLMDGVGGGAAGSFRYVDGNLLIVRPGAAVGYSSATNLPQSVSAANLTADSVLIRTVTQNLALSTNIAATGAVDLVAAQNFQNGANQTITANAWRIWQAEWTAESRGGLAGTGTLPNLYNCAYLGLCTVTVPGTGNHFIYAQQPTATVTVADASRDAGAANPGFVYSVTGLILGDTSASFSGSPQTSANASSPAGSYAIGGGNIASAAGYAISVVPGVLTVAALPVTPPPVVVPPVVPVAPASYLAELPVAQAFLDTSNIYTYTFDRNIAPPPICAATGPLDGDRPSPGVDVLAREWVKVRSRPNLASCVATERRNGCGDF